MKITVTRETHPGETRVSLTPEAVGRLVKLGAEVELESGIGITAGIADQAYLKAGATLSSDRGRLLGTGDVVLGLRKPTPGDIDLLKRDSVHISLLDPFNEGALIQKFAERGISAISLELIPRTTRAPERWT